MTKNTKPWTLTPADLASVTGKEFSRGTSRLLPPVEAIPNDFWKGNIYTRIVEALYVGDKPAPGEVTFLTGFEHCQTQLSKICAAHIKDVQVDYDHRIAGIGYMISKVVKVIPILT